MQVKIRRLNRLEPAAVRNVRHLHEISAAEERIIAAQQAVFHDDTTLPAAAQGDIAADDLIHVPAIGKLPHVAAIEAVAAMCGVPANDMAGDIIPAISSAVADGVSTFDLAGVIRMHTPPIRAAAAMCGVSDCDMLFDIAPAVKLAVAAMDAYDLRDIIIAAAEAKVADVGAHDVIRAISDAVRRQ